MVVQLVELHGGTIEAQSQGIGQGATFIVKLPIQEESKKKEKTGNLAQTVSVSSSPPQFSLPLIPKGETEFPNLLTGLRVLVVDDEADVRQWITAVLEECGAKVSGSGLPQYSKSVERKLVLLALQDRRLRY